ncbi:hypothetical protein BX281_4499 [Streptomyces sp. Ag82_O1-15]|nr:hypothetical protein BX281_4499 [Streptomyces sp. Ag82_O1-15]
MSGSVPRALRDDRPGLGRAVRHRPRERPGGQRGPLTGPYPPDRGKSGSKIHLGVDRRGIGNSTHLGRHGWAVERTLARLTGCRCLHRRYERKPDHFVIRHGWIHHIGA